MKEDSKNRCRALSNKNQQCKNDKMSFSQYCFFHQPKALPIFTLFLGGLIGLFINLAWTEIFPPKSERRKVDLIERITMEASGAIKYTDFFLTQYLNALGKKDVLVAVENFELQEDSLFSNSKLDKLLESAFEDNKMLDGSYTYNPKGQQLAYIGELLWNLKNTRNALDDFLKKYGSVDHELVTVVTQMIGKADVVIMILDYAFKNPDELIVKRFKEGGMHQFADFLSRFYFHQLKCKALIKNENKRHI